MKKSIILICLMILLPVWLFAQIDNSIRNIPKVGEVNNSSDRKPNHYQKDNARVERKAINNYKQETILFRAVVRRYSWFEGLGEPISQEVANHLPYYFKLSSKNSAGHYQVVEAMKGNELTTDHQLGTYILDKNYDDNEKNKKWVERLKTVNKWVLYCDQTGQEVVQERAFGVNGKEETLVYAMFPVRYSTNSVTISYLDAYGYPADMNENDDNTYGSVVMVTYDVNGFDSVIDYLDGAGYRKSNTDGVEKRRYSYDGKGNVLLATSCNFIGDYVIDNWGNCGIRYTYDKHGYTITYVDADLQPMRLPSWRGKREDSFVSCRVILDKWGRKKEIIYYDEEGKPDSILSNIHRIVYTYSNDGTVVKIDYYDINNNPL